MESTVLPAALLARLHPVALALALALVLVLVLVPLNALALGSF